MIDLYAPAKCMRAHGQVYAGQSRPVSLRVTARSETGNEAASDALVFLYGGLIFEDPLVFLYESLTFGAVGF